MVEGTIEAQLGKGGIEMGVVGVSMLFQSVDGVG